MRPLTLSVVLALVVSGCATIQGYPIRPSRSSETRQVGRILDPLLTTLQMPSLETLRTSDCKIGFAVVRTSKVNVWSTPPSTSPCLHFSLFVTEGALADLMLLSEDPLAAGGFRDEPNTTEPRVELTTMAGRVVHATSAIDIGGRTA